jgi:hypothetical protein
MNSWWHSRDQWNNKKKAGVIQAYVSTFCASIVNDPVTKVLVLTKDRMGFF